MQSLHPRIRLVWTSSAVVVALGVSAVAAGAATYYVDAPWLGGAAFAALLALGVAYQWYRYEVWGYRIRDDSVYLRHGVFVRVQKVVPFVRIQHIDTRRSPVERLTGLASLVIYTAGSRGADVRIPGLEPGEADELRERLKSLAVEDEHRREDAV
ncbi:MAG: PH domain-containing protein [Halobacteriales archaeon]